MNAKQTKLIAEADRMSESKLVRMEDWELAYLRVAMRNRVEETLNAELSGGERATVAVDEKPHDVEVTR